MLNKSTQPQQRQDKNHTPFLWLLRILSLSEVAVHELIGNCSALLNIIKLFPIPLMLMGNQHFFTKSISKEMSISSQTSWEQSSRYLLTECKYFLHKHQSCSKTCEYYNPYNSKLELHHWVALFKSCCLVSQEVYTANHPEFLTEKTKFIYLQPLEHPCAQIPKSIGVLQCWSAFFIRNLLHFPVKFFFILFRQLSRGSCIYGMVRKRKLLHRKTRIISLKGLLYYWCLPFSFSAAFKKPHSTLGHRDL